MAKTRESCFVNALFAITLLATTHFCNCEAVLSQKEQDKVSKLPGQNFNVSFAHYSGFVTTNENLGRALFYWFFEAVEDADSKPLVLWLNGGLLQTEKKPKISPSFFFLIAFESPLLFSLINSASIDFQLI